MDCFDNDLGNNFKNNTWNLEHNAKELREILNRIMQGVVSIIPSALPKAEVLYITVGNTFMGIQVYMYHFAWADQREKQGYKSNVSLKRGPRALGIHIRQIPRAHVTTITCI